MSNSLRDQLLKAGLVDEKRAKQVGQEQRRQSKQQPGKGKAEAEAARRRAQQAQAEKAARDRELNRQQQEEAQRKALRAQIKQLIEQNRLPKRDGEIAYNFTDGQKVKRIYVSEPVRQQLGSGAAVVVKLHGQYDIVPAAIADKIRERDPACIVTRDEPAAAEKPAEEDPYADYQVPDDLMW